MLAEIILNIGVPLPKTLYGEMILQIINVLRREGVICRE